MSRTWGDMEQDNCSSCSSISPLEGSNDTEIITVREDCVPGIPSEEQGAFLIERLLESYRRAMERLRLGQDDGGVPDTVPQHSQDNVEQDIKADR